MLKEPIGISLLILLWRAPLSWVRFQDLTTTNYSTIGLKQDNQLQPPSCWATSSSEILSGANHTRRELSKSHLRKSLSRVNHTCYSCNTKSTRYSGYSSNVPGLHILLRVELLTPFTSGLPFLLCSSFVLTLLIRKQRLVVLSIRSIVLRSQTYLRSVTPNSLLCSISGYSACCTP